MSSAILCYVPAATPPSGPDVARLVAVTIADLHRRHLAALIVRHDDYDFIVLFNHFAPRIKGYMKVLGVAEEEAEDLAQEVMLIVWRKADAYDPALSAVSSWIFTIARNLRIDALRRCRRRALDLDDPLLVPNPLPSPDATVSAAEQQRLVRAALTLLPPDQAEVVRLAFYEDCSHGEIAALLRIPLGTAKSRLRLAFQRLRQALGDETAHRALPPPSRAAA